MVWPEERSDLTRSERPAYPSGDGTDMYRMGDSSQEPPIALYQRKSDAGPQFGTYATCELCGRATHCFEEHGFVACQHCHDELLPGGSILSSL